MDKEQYVQRFQSRYNLASQGEWASSRLIDDGTFGEVFKLYAIAFRNLETSTHTREERKALARKNVMESVSHDGLTQPEVVTPELVAESAISHGCVVAPYLADKRGPEGSKVTVWSYMTKGRIDRSIKRALKESGKKDLLHEWSAPEDARRNDNRNYSHIQYPEAIDDSKIYGVSRPHRYLPANLIKTVVGIRDGYVSDEEYEALALADRNISLPHEVITDAVEKSESLYDVSNNIAIHVMRELQSEGLTDDQILQIVRMGYSPKGTLFENGDIDSARKLMQDFVIKLRSETETGLDRFADDIEQSIEDAYEEMGYQYSQSS